MTGPEILEFSRLVNELYSPAELRTLLQTLDRRFDDYVVQQATFPDQIALLVATANGNAWITELVVAVLRGRSEASQVRAFLASHPDWDPSRAATIDDPCDALEVLGGKKFIGRAAFRKFLKLMNRPTGKKVLIIRSDLRKVGKTYSTVLIEYVRNRRPQSNLAYVDLDTDDFSSGSLALKLAQELGIDTSTIPQQGQQQAARWNQELAAWLIPSTPPDLRVWWIVLDGFRQKIPSEATQDLVAQIAQRVQGTETRRLVLVNFTYRLPLAVDAFAYKETVVAIAADEVEVFLSKIHERKYGSPPTSEALSEYVAGVYEKFDQYTQEYPDEAGNQLLLHKAVTDTVDVILEDA